MSPTTVLGVVLVVVLLLSIATGAMQMASLLPLHGVLGVVAFAVSVAYAYVGRKFRPALALGALLSVLTAIEGVSGLAILPSQVEDPIATVHLFNGWAGFLIALAGVILVSRAARKAQGR
jgi:zinc transporter ZupT